MKQFGVYLLYVGIGLLAQLAFLLLSVVADFHENVVVYFYYLPGLLVILATSYLVPPELWTASQFFVYFYMFGMVAIFYSLIIAAIAHFIRYLIRRPGTEVET